RSASDNIGINSVTIIDGGHLRSGSYQVAIQLYNRADGKSTSWTIPSTPVGVTNNDGSGVQVGSATNAALRVTFTVTSEESEIYDSYRVAIIKNISGLHNQTVSVDILPAKELTGILQAFTYTGDEYNITSTIDEITAEDAPIKSANTVSQKSNILFLGGIT